MKRPIAKFEKVSFEQFVKDFTLVFDSFEPMDIEDLRKMYDNIQLPTRATDRSAGYDFRIPFSHGCVEGEEIIVPTGIRCKINNDWALLLLPKSGLGFVNKLRLFNTVGLVDADYYDSKENEGHIMVKFEVSKNKNLKAGDKFIQGTFYQYGTAEEEEVTTKRNGGFGSTGR